MDLKITPEVVKGFKDKDSKQERFRALYEKRDFIDAYAEHTNLRMADNPKGAIGREDEWESHGKLQLAFLVSQGMKPTHFLLDVGCGPGRAARRFVPYLDPNHYVGVDISEAALAFARQLSASEGWEKFRPVFQQNSDLSDLASGPLFDFIWAHSVFTHLPPQQIETMIANAAKILVPGGKFLFTYKGATKPQRSGLKQFQYPAAFFAQLGSKYGLRGSALPDVWPAHQLTFCLAAP